MCMLENPCSTAFSFSPTQPSTEGVSILRTDNRRAPPDRPVGRARDMRDHTTPWPASAYAMSLNFFFSHGTGRGFIFPGRHTQPLVCCHNALLGDPMR